MSGNRPMSFDALTAERKKCFDELIVLCTEQLSVIDKWERLKREIDCGENLNIAQAQSATDQLDLLSNEIQDLNQRISRIIERLDLVIDGRGALQ